MKKAKPSENLWHKASTAGIVANAIIGAIEVEIPELAMAGVEHCYTWAVLIWAIATGIII